MSRPRLGVRLLATALVLSFALARSGHAAAQSTAACSTPECANRDRLWAPAAQIHEIKNQFVAGVRQFTEAVAGTFGDEGPRLSASLDVMRRTLTQWDAAIRAYEAMVAALPGSNASAEARVALGTVYLDRDRRDDALREFAAAARLDPRRADVHRLSGAGVRAERQAGGGRRGASQGPRRSTRATASRSTRSRSNSARQPAAAKKPWTRCGDSRSRRGRGSATARGSQPSAPFERVSLLRQVAGVSPIFPLHAYRAGFARLLAGQYDAAIAELARAAAADPLAWLEAATAASPTTRPPFGAGNCRRRSTGSKSSPPNAPRPRLARKRCGLSASRTGWPAGST